MTPVMNKTPAATEQTAEIELRKLVEKMRFRLRESMAQRGNQEAFLQYLQSEPVER
jgi:hypothetical protein